MRLRFAIPLGLEIVGLGTRACDPYGHRVASVSRALAICAVHRCPFRRKPGSILKLLDRAAAAVVFMDAKLAGQRNIEPLGLSRDGHRRVYPGEIINESDSVAPV